MSTTTRYLVELSGCDDTTRFTLALTASEYDAVSRVAAATALVGGGCQPVLKLEDFTGVVMDQFDDIEDLGDYKRPAADCAVPTCEELDTVDDNPADIAQFCAKHAAAFTWVREGFVAA